MLLQAVHVHHMTRRMTSSRWQLQIKKIFCPNVLTHPRVEIRMAWCGIRLQEDMSCSKLLFGLLSHRLNIWNHQQKWSDDVTFCRGVEWRINKSTHGRDHESRNTRLFLRFEKFKIDALLQSYNSNIYRRTQGSKYL